MVDQSRLSQVHLYYQIMIGLAKSIIDDFKPFGITRNIVDCLKSVFLLAIY